MGYRAGGRGAAALAPYKVVLNGTHPEYYSEQMMDGTEAYLAAGGRVMYLGGNGYYWVVGYKPDMPWIMEVRKLEAGSRAWQARPGEHYLATTGERSGLYYTCINGYLQADELAYILNNSESKLLITSKDKLAVARQALRERKLDEAYQDWLRQLRDRTYVENRLQEQ